MTNVIQFPTREKITKPRADHLHIARMLMEDMDGSNLQLSWEHTVACSMTATAQQERELIFSSLRDVLGPDAGPVIAELERLLAEADQRNEDAFREDAPE